MYTYALAYKGALFARMTVEEDTLFKIFLIY